MQMEQQLIDHPRGSQGHSKPKKSSCVVPKQCNPGVIVWTEYIARAKQVMLHLKGRQLRKTEEERQTVRGVTAK